MEGPLRCVPPIPQPEQHASMDFEIGWGEVKAGISKFQRILAGVDGERITLEEDLHLYTIIYNVCSWSESQDCKKRFYGCYKTVLQEYIKTVVQPSLKEKHGEFLLRELVKRWKNHKVDDERDGQLIERSLLKDVFSIYSEIGRGSIGLYKIDFEDPFYKCTVNYYSNRAQTWMLKDSCSQYMFKLLEDTIKLELISRYSEQILNKVNSGCKMLLLDGKIEDLARIYRLFSIVDDGLSQVVKIFKEHIIEEGMSLVNAIDAASSRKDFAQKAIKLHEKQTTYLTSSFQNDTTFHKALKEAFELFCNKDTACCSCAESVAAFCDDLLQKGGSEKLSDEAVEASIDKVLELLGYLSNKDVCVEFLRMKHYLDLPTSKMEAMLSDMSTAREHQIGFAAYMQENYPRSVSRATFSVAVLKTGSWPAYKKSELKLPLEMANCVEAFKSYYGSKHKSRKLTWIYSLGSCSIIAHFDIRPIELIVTTYQAALLLLFNDADRLSCSEIVVQLNLPLDESIPLLQSLWKYKIIDKEPSNGTISLSDVFHLNNEFTDKSRRIKVPPPRTVEKKKVLDGVMCDRRHTVDACLVRIMKSRKVMTHVALVEECTKQLIFMFKPDASLVKRRIEDLMVRLYIERDDSEDPSVYKYMA